MEPVALHFAGKRQQGLGDVFEFQDELPVIQNALAAFSADVVAEIPSGDHMTVIGRVRSLVQRYEQEPLVFTRGRFVGIHGPRVAPSELPLPDTGWI
jgi:hypothetical protein